MYTMELKYFTKDDSFPFFIQYGEHSNDMFIHTHIDFSELVVVLSGSAVHIVDSEAYPINKGDVFVINSNTAHGFENAVDFKICNIMFRPQEMFDKASDIGRLSGYHALFVLEPYLAREQSFKSRLRLGLSDFDEVSTAIADMIREYQGNAGGRQSLIRAMFLSLAVKLSRIYSLPSEEDEHGVINIASSVSYIEKHYSEKITVSELAAMSYLSERHFSRVFTESYKTTPGAYIYAIRMTRAKLLLKQSSLSIGSIAERCGFSSGNFFTRQFRKEFGTTPGEYRKSRNWSQAPEN